MIEDHLLIEGGVVYRRMNDFLFNNFCLTILCLIILCLTIHETIRK